MKRIAVSLTIMELAGIRTALSRQIGQAEKLLRFHEGNPEAADTIEPFLTQLRDARASVEIAWQRIATPETPR